MSCEDCKSNNTLAPVPYIAHEADMARSERQHKRDFIIKLVLIILLVASNFGWIWYESQFETVSTTQEVTQEADNGTNTFVGGDLVGEAND